MEKRRVVVTGLGIVAPVGIGATEAWSNIVAGKSGITRITRFDPSGLGSQIAGEVKGFDVTRYLPAKEARRMDTFVHYGLAAAIEAIEDAGVQVGPHNAHRIGVNIGSGTGGLTLLADTHPALPNRSARKISPDFAPGTTTNMFAGNRSVLAGFKGRDLRS